MAQDFDELAFETRAKVPVEVEGKTVDLDFRIYDTGPLLNNSSPDHAAPIARPTAASKAANDVVSMPRTPRS